AAGECFSGRHAEKTWGLPSKTCRFSPRCSLGTGQTDRSVPDGRLFAIGVGSDVMEKTTAADLLVELLIRDGVELIFGIPGDGINGVMEALRKKESLIRFVQVRHEEGAALAAVAYAKFSGKLGVCLATTGPGAIHLLNGLYDAKMDQVPVLAITGLSYHDLIGTRYQQDVATDRLFSDVAHYSERIMGPFHVQSVVTEALRLARARRGVAHVAFPSDFQDHTFEQDQPSQMNQPGHTSSRWQRPLVVPMAEDLERAASVLNSGSKIAMLVGSGARGAVEEIEMVADLLGAPVAKALLGKDVLPDDSPFTTGTIGVLGTAAMNEADTLFMIGSSFPYVSYLPKPENVRCVQVDIKPENISLRFPAEVGLVGDARLVLRLLVPLLQRKSDRDFLEKTQSKMAEWWKVIDARGSSDEKPMRPQVVAAELERQLPDNAIICGDCGQNTFYLAQNIRIRGTQRFSCSGLLATIGNALPYAIGAQFAYPDRPVIAFAGDGGLTMTIGELATAAKYNLAIKVFVLKNNALGMIRWEQMMYLGNPEYGIELQNIDFARVAEGFGWKAFSVSDARDVARVVQAALQHDGPALVEATVDAFEPLLAGQIRPQQAQMYAEALKRGEPNRQRIGRTLFRDAVEDLEGNRQPVLAAMREKVPELIPHE
ncbi:MAG TPA: thiamine pyrophosphate-dependent enzyme, partial [Opitutaceae bacterium]